MSGPDAGVEPQTAVLPAGPGADGCHHRLLARVMCVCEVCVTMYMVCVCAYVVCTRCVVCACVVCVCMCGVCVHVWCVCA